MKIRSAVLLLMVLLTALLVLDRSRLNATSTQIVKIGSIPPIPNGGMVPPKLLAYSPPAYTPEALNQVVEGTVTLEAAFDVYGNLKVLRVINGLGFGLDDQAIAALKAWRFAPATREGETVPVIAQIDVDFKLPDAARTNLRLKQELQERLEELRVKYQQKEKAAVGQE